MKGLILKDLYMVKSYFRAFLLIIFAFIILSTFSADNAFFLFYPAILAGSLPFSLIAYDERSRWNQYCAALPVSRKTVVTSRYVITLIFFLSVLLLTALIQLLGPNFSLQTYMANLSMLVAVGLLTPTLLLPLTFRFGVEKGRFFYYFIIGAFCAMSLAVSRLSLNIRLPLLLLPAASIALFILSWVISVRIYEKKEL